MLCECFECAICMDEIDISKNITTTECGHKFHTSCLMTSVSHLGFGCPLCRTAMAEEVEDDEDEEYEDYEDDNELYDDYALRGLRFFTENLTGEEHSDEDLQEETEDAEYYETEAEEIEKSVPDVNYVSQKLIERGVTFEDMVCAFLSYQPDYCDDKKLNKKNGKIKGKFLNILEDFAAQHLE